MKALVPKSSESSSEFKDRFNDGRKRGQVVGSPVGSSLRGGIDTERVIAIDNGALRIGQTIKPGWGRAGLCYGPFERKNGLAFAVSILNGHNTSQAEPLPESLCKRLARWLLGPETESRGRRILGFLRSRQKRYAVQKLRQWIRHTLRLFRVVPLDENLAVGWFPTSIVANPVRTGSGFVMHATGAECGELWVRSGSTSMPVVRGVQNVPLHLITVLRETGAACYAASLPGVPGFATLPRMRLLGIDTTGSEKLVHAGIHQGVLGQIGFRVDTRVYTAQVALLSGYVSWYGSSQAADRLTGEGPLHHSIAEIGGTWVVQTGALERTPKGLRCAVAGEMSLALLRLETPSGFLRLDYEVGDGNAEAVGLVWRADERNSWRFEVGTTGSRLVVVADGVARAFPELRQIRLLRHRRNSLQIADDGEEMKIFLNGTLAFGTALHDSAGANRTGVGIVCRGMDSDCVLTCFEAHPRDLPIPAGLELDVPPDLDGTTVVAADDFAGPAGPLGGQPLQSQHLWHKEFGRGEFMLTGEGSARVVAGTTEPCPGRTAYTIPWTHEGFADLELTMTPPGPSLVGKDRGRGGLLFWQDPDNHIMFNLWMDASYGFSISSFYRVCGFEDIYDAVWTNIGQRVACGVPFRLRVSFDGMRFLARVNDEPVLYRALTDIYPDQETLKINRVGILANWEWGNDTGTVFHKFKARCRA